MIKNTKVIEIIEQEMCDLFRISADDMFEFKIDCGYAYLKKRFTKYPELQQTLAYSPVFWKWFIMIWTNRDRSLLYKCQVKKWGVKYSAPIKIKKEVWHISNSYTWDKTEELYKQFHKINSINMKLTPNSIVINRALVELELSIN